MGNLAFLENSILERDITTMLIKASDEKDAEKLRYYAHQVDKLLLELATRSDYKRKNKIDIWRSKLEKVRADLKALEDANAN